MLGTRWDLHPAPLFEESGIAKGRRGCVGGNGKPLPVRGTGAAKRAVFFFSLVKKTCASPDFLGEELL